MVAEEKKFYLKKGKRPKKAGGLPPRRNFIRQGKNESQRKGGMLEMHNIYPCKKNILLFNCLVSTAGG